MISGWNFFTKPPSEWLKISRERNSFFHMPAWQEVLTEAFGARPYYVLYDDGTEAFTMTVFAKGPFRIAYVGFPAGGMAGFKSFTPSLITKLHLNLTTVPLSVHLLRMTISPFSETTSLPYHSKEAWETVIPNLKRWNEDDLSSSLRRNIRRAKKNNLNVIESKPEYAEVLFKLYKGTMERHRGIMRYNLQYFKSLLQLSLKTSALKCWIAIKNGDIAASLIAASEGDTVFYMHGMLNWKYRQYMPSDLLLLTAINWAKKNNATVFNMMASPLDQSNLVRYKEKWGGVTRRQNTYDIDVKPFPAWVLKKGMDLNNLWQKRWW